LRSARRCPSPTLHRTVCMGRSARSRAPSSPQPTGASHFERRRTMGCRRRQAAASQSSSLSVCPNPVRRCPVCHCLGTTRIAVRCTRVRLRGPASSTPRSRAAQKRFRGWRWMQSRSMAATARLTQRRTTMRTPRATSRARPHRRRPHLQRRRRLHEAPRSPRSSRKRRSPSCARCSCRR